MGSNDELYDAIVFGERDRVVEIVQQQVDAGADVGEILNVTMIPALREVGDQFSRGEVFVPEMLVSARAMQAGVDIIEPLLVSSGHKPIARVCIGSVKGDLHDIGKNLVTMMLDGGGFEAIDLVIDLAPSAFVDAVREHKPDVVGMSALLTTTMIQMKATVDALEEAGLRDSVKIMIGGAPVTADFAKQIGADAYAPDAATAVELARELTA